MTSPNFFIVGTTKGGTSSLHLWLNQHPQICMSKPKELHYLCACPDPELHSTTGWDEYLSRFADCPVRGEASPCYLYEGAIANALIREFPEARLLVSLRDPVDRFWSHYLMNEIYRPTGLSAREILEQNLRRGHSNALTDLFGMGLYGRQLEAYLRVVDRERIHVTFLELLSVDPGAEVEQILAFLGVEIMPLDTSVKDKQYVEPRNSIGRILLRNESVRRIGVALVPAPARRYLRTRILGDPKLKPPIPHPLRDELTTLYRDDSYLLESILSRPLPWTWHRDQTSTESL